MIKVPAIALNAMTVLPPLTPPADAVVVPAIVLQHLLNSTTPDERGIVDSEAVDKASWLLQQDRVQPASRFPGWCRRLDKNKIRAKRTMIV